MDTKFTSYHKFNDFFYQSFILHKNYLVFYAKQTELKFSDYIFEKTKKKAISRKLQKKFSTHFWRQDSQPLRLL